MIIGFTANDIRWYWCFFFVESVTHNRHMIMLLKAYCIICQASMDCLCPWIIFIMAAKVIVYSHMELKEESPLLSCLWHFLYMESPYRTSGKIALWGCIQSIQKIGKHSAWEAVGGICTRTVNGTVSQLESWPDIQQNSIWPGHRNFFAVWAPWSVPRFLPSLVLWLSPLYSDQQPVPYLTCSDFWLWLLDVALLPWLPVLGLDSAWLLLAVSDHTQPGAQFLALASRISIFLWLQPLKLLSFTLWFLMSKSKVSETCLKETLLLCLTTTLKNRAPVFHLFYSPVKDTSISLNKYASIENHIQHK